MRTTINISDPLLAEAKLLAAKTNRSLGSIVDDALRILLNCETSGAPPADWTFPTYGFGGLQPTIVLSAHPEPTPGLLRLHFDVSPVGCDQDTELARLLAAGARPADVGQRGDEGWHVLADPEGNEFCLLRRQLEP